jgi:Abortive infection C-terminus
MDRRIPVAVIAVVSEALAQRYSHAQIDQFMESAGIEIAMVPIGNRQVKTRAWLKHANETMPDPLSTLGKVILELMEVMSPYEADPNETLRDKISKILADYNLAYHKGGLIVALGATVVGKTLQGIIHARDLSGLQTEFDRIYQNVESDPAAAVTASCSLLESLFKTYIEEQGLAMPAEQTVKSLWKVVRKDLKLDPAMVDDEDLKIILGGLAATVEGIGSLRTHKGSAHGRGKKAYKIESRHAETCRARRIHGGEFHSRGVEQKVVALRGIELVFSN